MEKEPETRIVGGASPEKKEQVNKEIKEALFHHFESMPQKLQELFKQFERPKSEKELALINFANEETSRLMREAGLKPYNVPVENFHIVRREIFQELGVEERSGATFPMAKLIILNDEELGGYPVCFGQVVLHELLHLKSHLSLEVEQEADKTEVTVYRTGVAVEASQRKRKEGGDHAHFRALYEAIVSETQKRLLEKMLNRPELEQEKKWLMSEEAKEMKKKIVEQEKIPEDDIYWFGEEKGRYYLWRVGYSLHRNVLNYICTEIQKEFSNKYQNADDVYKVFLNAIFTGRLLEIARIIEKTFGKGSFRRLGDMGLDDESANLCLEALKKARARQMRENEEKLNS